MSTSDAFKVIVADAVAGKDVAVLFPTEASLAAGMFAPVGSIWEYVRESGLRYTVDTISLRIDIMYAGSICGRSKQHDGYENLLREGFDAVHEFHFADTDAGRRQLKRFGSVMAEA